ncbi:contractile injection system protein, VgrG/Pvc8 family [Enterobacter mori]|uniref:contractile injection system protein, VgrG/Pvc8 family n=1 Tax=Enterobacter mori TaxID=539813 RepID=UPI003CFF5F25
MTIPRHLSHLMRFTSPFLTGRLSALIDQPQIPVPHIDQSQESDAAFLARLAERNGASVSVKYGKLLFLKAGSAVTASGKAIPQMTVKRGDGDRHQFAIADREAYTGVMAKWLQTRDQRPETAKAKGETQTQTERETPARAAAPESRQSTGKEPGEKGEGSERGSIWPVSLTTCWSSRPSLRQRRSRSGTRYSAA